MYQLSEKDLHTKMEMLFKYVVRACLHQSCLLYRTVCVAQHHTGSLLCLCAREQKEPVSDRDQLSEQSRVR